MDTLPTLSPTRSCNIWTASRKRILYLEPNLEIHPTMKSICLFITLIVAIVAIDAVYGDASDPLSTNSTSDGNGLILPRFKRSGIACELACKREGKSGGTCRKCSGYISAACGNGWVCVCKGVTNYCN